MLRGLPLTFKPVLQQIRLLQVAKTCCRKWRVALLLATKSEHVAQFTGFTGFTGFRQTCFAGSDESPCMA